MEDLSHGERPYKESSTETVRVAPIWTFLFDRVLRGNQLTSSLQFADTSDVEFG